MKRARRGAVTCALIAVVALACRASPVPGDAPGDADAGHAVAASTARTCGPGGACDEGEYCAYAPRLCGKGKRPGVCQRRPARCDDARSPVCGCDGKVYDSECQALAAGVDLDVTGACRQRIPGWAACGPRYCDAEVSYCEIVLSDVLEPPTDYACKALPAACTPVDGAPRACTCFPAGTRCLSFCGPIETGGLPGFHLTCRL